MSQKSKKEHLLISEDASNLMNELSSSVLFNDLENAIKQTSLVAPDPQSVSEVSSDSKKQQTVEFSLPTSVDVTIPSGLKTSKEYEKLIQIPTEIPKIEGKQVEIPTTLDGYTEDEIRPHSLIISERNKALKMMDELLEEIKAFEKELDEQIKVTDVCPYQQTLNEFLGVNFVCPTIEELPLPINFDAEASVRTIFEINERQHNLFLAQMERMAVEAADMSFVGVTSQNLNNAFAPLSTTANGQEFVFDRQKFAKHLEFAETVKNLSDEYILQHPFEVAQKLVTRYIEIHQ